MNFRPAILRGIVAAVVICAPLSHALAGNEMQLSLSEAVQSALLNNLGLRLKQHDVAHAEGQLLETHGAFAPVLSAEAAATDEKTRPVSPSTAGEQQTTSWQVGLQQRLTTGTLVDLSFDNNTLDTDSDYLLFDPVYRTGLSLTLTQPLLKGRGTEVQTAGINAARSSLEAQTFLVDDQAALLAAQVKTAYWDLVYAHQNRGVLQLSVTLAKKLRDETAAMIEAGKLAAIDRFQPESEVALREQELISGQRAIGVAEDNLKLLLNSNDWNTSLLPIDKPDTGPVVHNFEDILERALAERPDIKAAALQIQAAHWKVVQAENGLLPSLDLQGGAGFGGTDKSYGDAVNTSFDDNDRNWHLGLKFSHPLDNAAAEGQHRQAIAQHRKARTELELLKQDIRRQIKTAVRETELAIKTIDAAEKTVLARKKSLEAEQAKFAAGRSTTLDVLTAQQMYAQALSAQHRAKVVYVQTLAEIDRLQGLIALPSVP